MCNLNDILNINITFFRREVTLMKRKPNLLYIFADQWRRQSTGFMDANQVVTPRIDALAQESTILTQAISACPLCSPYRGSLFTGKYPLSTGVYTNCKTGLEITLKDDELSLGRLLKESGYATGYVGKWHLDVPETNHTPYPLSGAKNWDAFTPPGPKRHGFDFWYAYGADDSHFTPHYWKDTPEQICVNEWSVTHETSVAMDYITQHATEPFALFISYNPPHSPYDLVPDRYLDLYKDQKVNFRANVTTSTFGYHTHEPQTYTKDALEIMTKQYYAAITGVDEHIGHLVDCLKANGIYDDTLIVITSDHGDMMGSHGLMAKHVWYEESVGVPFILHWKNGTLKPMHSDVVLDTTDIMPTLLDLLSLSKPATIEGTSIAPYLVASEQSLDTSEKLGFLCAFPGRDVFQQAFDEAGLDPKAFGWRGVRAKDYTYVIELGYYPECQTPKRYLYDLKNDPYQLSPVDPKSNCYKEIAPLLETKLKQWLTSQKDGFLAYITT